MRIAIVNDMPLAAEALRRAVSIAPQHEIAWVEHDGADAVKRCALDRPDLILMDLVMPRMDGVEATRLIMANTPCAILIVTASVDENSARTFAAMGHGALDAVDLPKLSSFDPEANAAPLLRKIASLSRLISVNEKPVLEPVGNASPPLIAIGASAGGPAALGDLLSALPRNLRAAVENVQHVDERFASGMADWLNVHSNLPVRLARDGDLLEPGTVLLAGTSDHLVLKEGRRVQYVREPRDEIYRPSINVLFHSLCTVWKGPVIGVLLTGMGSDGARGLKALRDSGCHTIAQDSESSAVFGMPRAAAEIAAAVEILPLKQIAPALVNLVAGNRA